MTVAAAACLVLGACGGEATETGEVTKTVRAWTDAMSRADGPAACSRMTPGAGREMAVFGQTKSLGTKAADCPSNVKQMIRKLTPNATRQMHDADVDTVALDGSRAVVHMARGGPNEVVLVRDGDGWLIDHAFAKGWRLSGSPSFGLGGG
jgi:hypothetical protein